MGDTRIHDLQELRKAWYQAKDPSEKQAIERAGEKIQKETGKIKSMREALINAHRQGNKGNIKDIHDIVEHKEDYRHG